MPYQVYVIRLDRAAMGDKPARAFRDQNDHIDWDYPLHGTCKFYYVGQSAHSPECRFAQHKHCHGPDVQFYCICKRRTRITKSRSNRFVRRYGLFLQKGLYAPHNPITRRRVAEEMEAELAGRLKKNGHCAYYN